MVVGVDLNIDFGRGRRWRLRREARTGQVTLMDATPWWAPCKLAVLPISAVVLLSRLNRSR